MQRPTDTYPEALRAWLVAAAFLVPFLMILVAGGATLPNISSAAKGTGGPGSEGTQPPAAGPVVAGSSPSRVWNATNFISDGTFDAVPGPWIYTNGTTRAVTAAHDPTARARLGRASSALTFDSMDNIFGPTPWTSAISGSGLATSQVSQATTIRVEGNGSMRDDVRISQNNEWGGAERNDPLPWNWSRYGRFAMWIDKATPASLWAWVTIQDQSGRSTFGLYVLVDGWYRYAFDLNASTVDLAHIDFVQIAFAGAAGTTATLYVDDIVLIDSTTFAETASVAQMFTKSTSTGSSPNSLRLTFDLAATPSLNVVSRLQVAIGNTVEWSETSVAGGKRAISVDVSGDVALRGTGSFALAFSLRLNRTGWEEASMTAWIDNVTLVQPGTLARIAVTPSTAFVPVGYATLFTADGWDGADNPVPLTALIWSSTIGQIVAANGTAATLQAPREPGSGVVIATKGNISGTAKVTVDVSGAPPIPPASPWGAILWPGLAVVAAVVGGTGLVALRRSAGKTFKIEELFLIQRDGGLLIGHSTRRRDIDTDEDIYAGMLTAIMAFAHDTFREEREGLKQFEIGNKKVALERGQHLFVAAIGVGLAGDRLSTSLQDFLADIEERYGNELRRWSGMISDLPGIGGMVESLARRGRYRRGDWRKPEAPEPMGQAATNPEHLAPESGGAVQEELLRPQ